MLGRKIHQVFLTSVNQIAMPDIVPVPQKDFETIVGPVRVIAMTVVLFLNSKYFNVTLCSVNNRN